VFLALKRFYTYVHNIIHDEKRGEKEERGQSCGVDETKNKRREM
jgi:hypothetical protein